MKIPYFPGCTLKNKAQNLEIPALEVAGKLGIEMIELENWNCCGAVASLASDDLMKQIAPVRNFLRVLEMNEKGITEKRLLTLCSMCYNTLKLSNIRLKKNPDDLQKINDLMYKEELSYDGSVEVVHFFNILQEYGFGNLADRITNPLHDLKIASYYGCTLLRPHDVSIDNIESPEIMENFVRALGAEAVEWNHKSRCCGSYHTVNNKDIVISLTKSIIDDARKNGAELIITSCPLCAFNLDSRQKEIKNKFSEFESMPILYFTQVLGLAFDLEIEKLGFDLNYVSPQNLLKNKKLL